MKLKWFIKSASALVLAFALAFSFSTVLAKPKQSKKPKLWYYENYMLTYDFKHYNRMFYALVRVNNKNGTGILTQHYHEGIDFFYNGNLLTCEEKPRKDGLTYMGFFFGVTGDIHKNNLQFKISKKDVVPYVWGEVNDDTVISDLWVSGITYDVKKHSPFHIIGIEFRKHNIYYLVETLTAVGSIPMEKVKIVKPK